MPTQNAIIKRKTGYIAIVILQVSDSIKSGYRGCIFLRSIIPIYIFSF